ncbi:HD domain-containing phosphohydrolase [Delftia tsuruhatensis]
MRIQSPPSSALTMNDSMDQVTPDGLKGKDIPIGGRTIAVADFYDDLIVGYLSSKPLTCAEARTLISNSKGTQFVPEVVDAFLQIVIQAPPVADPAHFMLPVWGSCQG